MFRSLPIARLHTLPRTLGGKPAHHNSRTFRVFLLKIQEKVLIARYQKINSFKVKNEKKKKNVCHNDQIPNSLQEQRNKGIYQLYQFGITSSFHVFTMLEICFSNFCRSFNFFFSFSLSLTSLRLAKAIISSYCWRCFNSSSADLGGRWAGRFSKIRAVVEEPTVSFLSLRSKLGLTLGDGVKDEDVEDVEGEESFSTFTATFPKIFHVFVGLLFRFRNL